MTSSAVPVAQPDAVRGAVLVVGGMGLLTLNDALMRMLVAELPLGQAVAMRGLSGCAVMLACAPMTGGLSALRPNSYAKVAILSGLMLIMLFLFPWSLQRMPLADGIMLVSASPVIAALLAPLMLSETIGWRRWSAIVLGLIGIGLIINPGPALQYAGLTLLLGIIVAVFGIRAFRQRDGGESRMLPGAIAVLSLALLVYIWPQAVIAGGSLASGAMNVAVPVVLLCAFLVALRDILTQQYILGESAMAIVFVANVFALLGGTATLPFWSELPEARHWALAVTTGALVSISMALSTYAFRHAGAVAISCLKYSGILWAVLFGWVFFAELLSPQGWIGALLITLSGVIIAIRRGG